MAEIDLQLGCDDEIITATQFEIGVSYRLRRLKKTRDTIEKRKHDKREEKKQWGDIRLWLVCLAHEVDYISQSEDIIPYAWKGINRKSAAIKMATKYPPTAARDYKRSSPFVQFMTDGGPASILVKGGSQSM